ncbi:MAG: glycerol-3-phosphate dehydrogenase/oxidase [Chloroflexota bacterium]
MWNQGWRDRAWSELDRPWDVIVIGGGITGAGILREAVRAGLRTLLVEAHDFASGTSSRSGKLVHGGLRYLRTGQLGLTLQSVRERERLLREGRGLVCPLPQLMVCFRRDPIPPWVFGAGLALYDLLALKWGHRRYGPSGLRALCPPLADSDLLGGYRYFDAQTDDARLVLRLIREAVRAGGIALNYARVEGLLRRHSGRVSGVILRDQAPGASGRTAEVQAPVVISATGAWADELRAQVGGVPRLRHLRGSHLFFPAARLPLTRAVCFLHPHDHRPLYVFPWEGVIIAGTTDVDHGRPVETDPAIQPAEAEYLLTALRHVFPSLDLGLDDVLATQAGIRAVVGTGKADPSQESREHVLWEEDGLLTVTGGKLTTFLRMACDALHAVRSRLPVTCHLDDRARVLEVPPSEGFLATELDPSTRLRLLGRYGADASALLAAAHPDELKPIDGCLPLWAELRWAARAEGVVHLEDLLLRRVRLGLTAPCGGLPLLDRIRRLAQAELGWDDDRWQHEAQAYAALWKACYSPPGSWGRTAEAIDDAPESARH